MTSFPRTRQHEPSGTLLEPFSAADLQKSVDTLFRTYVSYGKLQGISTAYRLELQVTQLELLLTFTRRLSDQYLAENESDIPLRGSVNSDSLDSLDENDNDDDDDLTSEF